MLIQQRERLFRAALAHECWLATPPAEGEAGEIQRAGILLSLSAALLLYDNYPENHPKNPKIPVRKSNPIRPEIKAALLYGPGGSVTLQSGGAVGGYASWGDLAGSLGKLDMSNVSTVIANAAIGAAQIGSLALVGSNNFSVRTALSGARMEMDSRAIKVFDENGVLRVQMGDLSV
jgi:hypothetical protein